MFSKICSSSSVFNHFWFRQHHLSSCSFPEQKLLSHPYAPPIIPFLSSFAISYSQTFPNNLDKYILKFGQIHLEIWTNTCWNLNKYILKFGQIHFEIWTNTFCIILLVIFWAIVTVTTICWPFYSLPPFCNLLLFLILIQTISLDNNIWQLWQIHFVIVTNTFCNLDKYILQ